MFVGRIVQDLNGGWSFAMTPISVAQEAVILKGKFLLRILTNLSKYLCIVSYIFLPGSLKVM